ncbi:hypothetical protein Nmel_014103 [Mimus melanotis]
MKHQDPGMYKGSAYSGYPFLMLSDPYLPNGSMTPLVSSSFPYGEVLWPLSLLKYVAGVVQAPTHAFFLTNQSPVSEIPGHCSVQAERRSRFVAANCYAAHLSILLRSPHLPAKIASFYQNPPNRVLLLLQ